MSRPTLDPAFMTYLSFTGLSPSLACLPRTILLGLSLFFAVRTPVCSHTGLGSSLFARRYLGNRCFFLFLRLLRCFSSPGSPLYTIFFIYRYMALRHVGSPIQISAALWIFAPPRGFSQLITSFFGSQCQGILPAPFLA